MRTLAEPDPGFADDDGAASAELASALASYQRNPDAQRLPTLAVLQSARLIVPVVAVLGEVEYDEHGRARDKTSDMATVLLTGRDGRTALLAFTGTEALAAWNPQARPVPVTSRRAAEAAVAEGAAALVLDVAGPVIYAVEEDDLRALAEGYVLSEVSGQIVWTKLSPSPDAAAPRL